MHSKAYLIKVLKTKYTESMKVKVLGPFLNNAYHVTV